MRSPHTCHADCPSESSPLLSFAGLLSMALAPYMYIHTPPNPIGALIELAAFYADIAGGVPYALAQGREPRQASFLSPRPRFNGSRRSRYTNRYKRPTKRRGKRYSEEGNGPRVRKETVRNNRDGMPLTPTSVPSQCRPVFAAGSTTLWAFFPREAGPYAL